MVDVTGLHVGRTVVSSSVRSVHSSDAPSWRAAGFPPCPRDDWRSRGGDRSAATRWICAPGLRARCDVQDLRTSLRHGASCSFGGGERFYRSTDDVHWEGKCLRGNIDLNDYICALGRVNRGKLKVMTIVAQSQETGQCRSSATPLAIRPGAHRSRQWKMRNDFAVRVCIFDKIASTQICEDRPPRGHIVQMYVARKKHGEYICRCLQLIICSKALCM